MDAEQGDKVRLKNHPRQGERGVIVEVRASQLLIVLDDSKERLLASRSEVTNYSLAARKAWKKMPQRQVGRPKGSGTADRVSVTLRIDREVWERFKLAEMSGLIEDRTATINSLLVAKLAELDSVNKVASIKKKDL